MAEYIEREALVDVLAVSHAHHANNSREASLLDRDIRLIWEQPAADVAPVVHGYWIPSESDFDDDDTLFDVEDWCDWQCSACHTDIYYEDPMERRWLPKFCPNCGARMDGE